MRIKKKRQPNAIYSAEKIFIDTDGTFAPFLIFFVWNALSVPVNHKVCKRNSLRINVWRSINSQSAEWLAALNNKIARDYVIDGRANNLFVVSVAGRNISGICI